jgi:hypothetical protein
MDYVFKFQFESGVELGQVDEELGRAVIAAQSLFGEVKVVMDAAFSFNPGKRYCVIDPSSEVSRCIAIIFLGFITARFGESRFRLERVDFPRTSAEMQLWKNWLGNDYFEGSEFN